MKKQKQLYSQRYGKGIRKNVEDRKKIRGDVGKISLHQPNLENRSYISRKRSHRSAYNRIPLDELQKQIVSTSSVTDIEIEQKPEMVSEAEFIQTADNKSEMPKKRKRIFGIAVSVTLILLITCASVVYYQLPYRCVKPLVTIEAGGQCPSVSEFLNWENDKAWIVSDLSDEMIFEHVKDYEVVIHLYGRNVATRLEIVDTIPPEIVTHGKTIMLGESFSVDDFIENITDVTDYTVGYKEEPKYDKAGVQTLTIEAVDEGGNIASAEAVLEILQDTTPPSINGIKEITITVGDSISYKKGITVTDDFDDNVKLVVDNSEVDTSVPGDYTVIYKAKDKYGNEARVTTTLHVKAVVKKTPSIEMTEENVLIEADKILVSITNDTMSQYEKIHAIYNWCHNRIAYTDGAPKSNWVEGAYWGLVRRRGDCYTYAMTAKCLLTRAGIVNMDIEKIPANGSMHFWNLVDIGEGWRHFDTCRRYDGSTFFYLTDSELMAYSDTHNGTHNYDRNLYPVIP